MTALVATQHSSASMGEFDKAREGELECKKSVVGKKCKSFVVGATDTKVTPTESERNLKLLQSLGPERKKAVASKKISHLQSVRQTRKLRRRKANAISKLGIAATRSPKKKVK